MDKMITHRMCRQWLAMIKIYYLKSKYTLIINVLQYFIMIRLTLHSQIHWFRDSDELTSLVKLLEKLKFLIFLSSIQTFRRL